MYHQFLIGNMVYLRGLEIDDIKGNYFQWFNDQEVNSFNSHGYFPNNFPVMEDYIKRLYNSKDLLVLAIISRKDEIHIGNISLQHIDWISRCAEYAILVGERKFWGKGMAKEASDLILRHGFISLNLQRIYCGTAEDNIGMQKLAAYMGMKQEGVRRKAFYKGGKYKDIIEYGILREEYLEKNNEKNI